MSPGRQACPVSRARTPLSDALGAVALAAALALVAGRTAAQTSAAELEDASEVARRAATASLRGQPRVLAEALDIDGIVSRRVGPDVWTHLTERQRQGLRALVRQAFASALSPDPSSPGEIAWSSARGDGSGAVVFLGIRFGERWLKTRWSVRRIPSEGWKVEDVVLCDPGVSLAADSLRPLGDRAVSPRDRRQQAREAALPRLLFVGIIALVVVLAAPRLEPPKRILLLLAASAVTVLFLLEGTLAVRQALAEAYRIAEPSTGSGPGRWERLARAAEKDGPSPESEALWDRASAAGAPRAPMLYERGMAARERGDDAAAQALFRSALEARPPAPGAERELALAALSEKRSAEARERIGRYLSETGPDPDALSIAAVADTNLGRPKEALEEVRQARDLVGGGRRGAELAARVQARAGDATGAVAVLREIDASTPIDRESLRSDPGYLPIANDPAWIAFLNAHPATPTPARAPAPAR